MMLRKSSFAKLRPISARIRLRRRLYMFSAPVILGLLLAAIKLISVGIVGNAAVTDFTRHDIEALRHDVSMLSVLDVMEPAKTSVAAGDLAVLQGRLHEADDRFSEALSRTNQLQSCPFRINLLLVRETLGDLATQAGSKKEAERLYTTAVVLASDAPSRCFVGNDDPNPDRRAIRESAIPRLQQKLELLRRPAASLPPPGSTVTPQEPPTSLTPLTSAAPLPGLPALGSPPLIGPGSEQSTGTAPTPGPGPNMPQLPQTGVSEGPVFGPDDGNGQEASGAGALNPVSPDRLPTIGGGAAPGHRLGTGDPLERLQRLLDNSNAYGDSQE